MKSKLLTLSLIPISLITFSCGGSDSSDTDLSTGTVYDGNVSDVFTQLENLPKEELSQDEIDALKFMWNEEKMAKDLYYSLYEMYSNLQGSKVFYNIAKRSETVHQEIVEALLG